MGEPNQFYSDYGLDHEQVYAELQKLKDTNFHLKRQLKNKENRMYAKDEYIRKLEKKLRSKNGNEQHYRNGRKRGSRGFKG